MNLPEDELKFTSEGPEIRMLLKNYPDIEMTFRDGKKVNYLIDFKWIDNGDEIVLAALYFDPKSPEGSEVSPHIK